MSPLVDRPPEKGGVGVLIVAVGCYEHGLLPDLPIGSTVKRLVEFWLEADSAQRSLPGSSVSRLDVLVSVRGTFVIRGKDGKDVPIRRASADNVHAAIRAWRDHCRDASMAVVHWIGHGDLLGEGGGQIHLLACEDVNERGALRSVDWSDTLRTLRLTLGRAQLVSVIDACRSRERHVIGKNRLVFNEDVDEGSGCDSATLYACEEGERTFALIEGHDLGWGFKDGGSMHSEAILQAFHRFGAAEKDDAIGPAIYSPVVQEAVSIRLRRWSSRLRDPAWPAPSPRLDSRGEMWRPLLRTPDPHAMVDLVPGEGSDLIRGQCVVRAATRQDVTPHVAEAVWEADLSWQSWQAEVNIDSLGKPGPHSQKKLRPRNAFERRTMPKAQRRKKD